MLIKELHDLTGGLSEPSKMPGFAYGTPAIHCKLGSLLRSKKGSVCHICYAFKGMYSFPVVKNAQQKRFLAMERPDWARLMVELIEKKYRKKEGDDRVFRWHDSGDIQSVGHVAEIVWIAKKLPTIQFWLPTRERAILKAYLENAGVFPNNLVVRLSATMVGKVAKPMKGVQRSSVGSGEGFACPARTQGNECGSCRKCWDKTTELIDYPAH